MSDLRDILKKALPQAGDEALDRFEIYHRLLAEWNERMNLTAITDPVEVAEKHFADSLAAPERDRLPGDPALAAEIMAERLLSFDTAGIAAAGADLFPVAILRAGGADLIFQLIVMAICTGIFRSA